MVNEDIIRKTIDFNLIKCMIKITVENKQFQVDVFPSSSSLILKALNEAPRNRKIKNITHNGNISVEELYNISRILRPTTFSKKFSGTVCQILGTCRSIGCTVGGMAAKDFTQKIKSGVIECPEN